MKKWVIYKEIKTKEIIEADNLNDAIQTAPLLGDVTIRKSDITDYKISGYEDLFPLKEKST